MHSDMHPVYVLYFMYFDTWKQLNSPWYEKTNQQCFQLLKIAWSWSAIDHVQSPADYYQYTYSWKWYPEQFQKPHKI